MSTDFDIETTGTEMELASLQAGDLIRIMVRTATPREDGRYDIVFGVRRYDPDEPVRPLPKDTDAA